MKNIKKLLGLLIMTQIVPGIGVFTEYIIHHNSFHEMNLWNAYYNGWLVNCVISVIGIAIMIMSWCLETDSPKDEVMDPKFMEAKVFKYGRQLEFISWIVRDGSGTTPVGSKDMDHLANEKFSITCLSMTEKTYIAAGFNSYVVKLKPDKQ